MRIKTSIKMNFQGACASDPGELGLEQYLCNTSVNIT